MLGHVFAWAQSPLFCSRQLFCTTTWDHRSRIASSLTYTRRFSDIDAEISFGLGHVDIAVAATIVVIESHLRRGAGIGRVVVLVLDGSTKAVEDTTLSVSQLEEKSKRADTGRQAQRPLDE
jgi:hypothetical protein